MALSSLGCSVQTENFDSDVNAGSVHAVVQVRSVEMYDNQPHGDALAAFVRIPADQDAQGLLNLAGLWPSFPPPGSCATGDLQFDSLDWTGQASDGDAELLSADDVRLLTPRGFHQLAPHAFPSAYDLLRGVVYSSRDRLSGDLPEDAQYLLAGSGVELGDGAAPTEMRSRQLSPKYPTEVIVSGQPFSGASELAPTNVLDFSWRPSEDERDVIVVALSTSTQTYRCGFADRDGAGSMLLALPSGNNIWAPEGEARVAVHRVRTTSETHPEFAQITVGFDFAIEKNLIMRSARSSESESREPSQKELAEAPLDDESDVLEAGAPDELLPVEGRPRAEGGSPEAEGDGDLEDEG